MERRRLRHSQRYVIDNLLILGLGCAIVFLAGQRTRASLAVFTGFCLLWGTANFFIITFKGQPIVPADLFALGTAASVAGGYSLFLTGRLAFCWALFAAYCIALAKLCPQRKRARWDIAANMLAAALLVCLGAMQYQAIDIKKDCEVTVDVWDVRGSYATQGTALCFLSRAQELTPKPPEGYSAEAVDAILAPFAEDPLTGTDGTVAESPSPDTTGNQNSTAPTTGDAAPEQPEALPYDGPNVIAIMNETFSDLSEYPGLEGTNAAPTFFHEVCQRFHGRGRRVRLGHGRGHLQQRVRVPHRRRLHGQHGRRRVPMCSTIWKGWTTSPPTSAAWGYGTHAIHPAEAANWRRDRIYEQLGFDAFDDITTMEDADTFRDLVTDRTTYERVLEKIDEGEGPQFVFDVTIQNHGGYDTGLVPPLMPCIWNRTRWKTPRWTSFWRPSGARMRICAGSWTS